MFSRKNRMPAAPKADASASSSRKAAPDKPDAVRSAAEQAREQARGQPKGKGKLAYESRRAEKAGMGLEKWMAEKERRVQAEREAIQRAKRKPAPGRQADAAKPGLLRRLLDRAHRPL